MQVEFYCEVQFRHLLKFKSSIRDSTINADASFTSFWSFELGKITIKNWNGLSFAES